MRTEWPDDPIKASEAAAEWNAAYRARRIVAPGREAMELAPQMWQQYATDLRELREQLTAIPVDDRDTWPRIARQTSGGAVGLVDHGGGGARSPSHRRRCAGPVSADVPPPNQGTQHVRDPFAGAALMAAAVSRLGQGTVGQAAMLRELVNLCHTVAEQTRDTRQASYA